MADSGLKQIRISKDDLPPIGENNDYQIRYRVISEDKNKISHWSPIFNLQPDYTFVSGNIDFNASGNIITSIWDQVIIKKDSVTIEVANEYDIWVKFDRNDGGDWVYKQRVVGNTINLIHPSTYTINGVIQPQQPNKFSIEVYLKGTPISRGLTFLKVYQDGPHTV